MAEPERPDPRPAPADEDWWTDDERSERSFGAPPPGTPPAYAEGDTPILGKDEDAGPTAAGEGEQE